jgi:hypothetical protein
MRRTWILVLASLSLAVASRAERPISPAIAAGLQCRTAVDAAERGSRIPPHLLAAIGRVESGRRDPVTGAWHPWPWTVNAEGQGLFYESKAAAVAAVRSMQAQGMRSIDVGCMQVNLMHHPNAFASLEMAFEPQANATYAAQFLTGLFAQTGHWAMAAALYHSATPDLAADYQRKVLAAWPEEQRVAVPVGVSPLARAWGATMTAAPPGFTRIVRMQPPRRSLDAHRAAPNGLAYGG